MTALNVDLDTCFELQVCWLDPVLAPQNIEQGELVKSCTTHDTQLAKDSHRTLRYSTIDKRGLLGLTISL